MLLLFNGVSLSLDISNGYEEGYKEKKEKVVGRKGFEPSVPAMSRRYPNQARPPARDTMKKFVAQIYVVDRLYMETN